jgi:hypothetical protein
MITADAIRAGLVQRGLPGHVADGFVMNFRDESGLNPAINEIAPLVQGSRGGFGLAQWTGPRRRALESFAQQRGVPVSDMDAQLDFLMTELQGPESRAAQAIMAAPDAGAAADAVLRQFLRPAAEHVATRSAAYTGGLLAGGGGSDTMTGNAGNDRMAGLLAPQEPARRPSIWDRLEGVPILGGLADPDRRARLAMGFNSMTLNPDPTFAAMQMQGINQRADERETTARLNQTVAYLESIGRGDLAALAMIDPSAALGQSQGPSELEQIQLAQAQLDLEQDRAGGTAGGVDYSQTPIYGVNENGDTVVLQVGDNGTAVQTVLPPGVTVDRPGAILDTGTEFIIRDPTTNEIIERIPKDPGGAAAATARGAAVGAAEGQAVAGLSDAIAQADQSVNLIDQIYTSPALPSITGMVQGRLPAGLPLITGGQAGADLSVKVEQLQGQAFLQAFESLKGAGAITEQEGAAATRAIARLSTVQSPEEYREALLELRGIIAAGRSRALAAAGQAGEQITTSALPPTADEINSLLDKYNPVP